MKKSIFKFLTFGLAAFLAFSCFSGCNNDLSSGSSDPSITSVSITPESTEIEATGTTKLVATVTGENLEGYNLSYDWEASAGSSYIVPNISDDKSKTTTSTATLSVENPMAESGTVRVNVTVYVTEKDGTYLGRDNSEKTSEVITITVKGKTTTTTYEIGGKTVVVSSDGKATITDASGNKVDATVETSEGGTVTIKDSDGKTLYTATVTEEGKIDTGSVKDAEGQSVTVEEKTVAVESITLNKTEESVEEEKSVLLTATVEPYNASDKTVTWTTSDESVATVENGNVTGKKAGKATITAKAGEKTATATITVTEKATTKPDDDDKSNYTVTVIDSDGKEVNGAITQANGEIVFTNPNPVKNVSRISGDIWKYHVKINLPSDVKKGKNYKVSADIKADKETSYFELETKDDFTYSLGNRELNDKITADYATYSVTTGTAAFDWTKGVLNVAAGTISKLYIKNIKVEEISDIQNFGTHKVPNAAENLSSALTITEDASAKTLALDFASANKINDLGVDIALLNEPFDVGSLYKVSFDVTSNEALLNDTFAIWGHVLGDDYEAAGSEHFSFDANTKKNITLYLPVYQKESESVRIPYIWFSSSKVAKITISDIKAEKVTDFEKEFGNSELSLRYAGTASSFYEWQLHHEDEFMIPAKSGECHGQLILSDEAGWNSERNAVTSFRVLEKGTGSGLNPEVKTVNGATNIYFENTSDKNIYVEFDLNEKFEVTITKVPGYTVVYNGEELVIIPESALSYYVSEYELAEETDYTVDETTKTITLTDSGFAKISETEPGEDVYTVVYNGEELDTIPESALSYYVSEYELAEGTDYTLSGTTITLADSGFAKVSEVDVSKLYVKGSFNDWADNSDYQLNNYKTEADGSKIYEIPFTATYSEETFKVANSNWSIEYSGAKVYPDEEYAKFTQIRRSLTDNSTENSYIYNLTPTAEYKLTIKENEEGFFVKVTLTKPAEDPVETTYTVVYNGKEIEKIPEYGLTSFESFLTAGSDYTLDETTKTITLTENGYSKIQKAMVTVIDVSEGNVENTSFVPASEFDQIEFPVYSDAACTKQIPDTSKIKAGDTVYIKLGDIIA